MTRTRPNTKRAVRTRGLALMVIACVALGGCWFQGGPLVSRDLYTYDSTPDSPKTITIYDTRTNEVVWGYDLPVGRRLIMKFKEGEGPDEYFSAKMVWEDIEAFRNFAVPEQEFPVPPYYARLIEMQLRPVPEMPGTNPVPLVAASSENREDTGEGEPAAQ